jgi:Thymidylate synthase complementing protein
MYHAKVLADSVTEDCRRLITIEITFPRFILAEVNTHRVFSRNSASSRAIPTERIIERVKTNPFIPETFNQRVKGMGVGDALDSHDQKYARRVWLEARTMAVEQAELLSELDVDKSRVNRLLEPFMWHTAIITSTEWDNFYALRYHPHAQPEFQYTAKLMLEAMRTSRARLIEDHQFEQDPEKATSWHLPLVADSEIEQDPMGNWKLVSAGRCARVSFDRHSEFEDPVVSKERAERLMENGHLSPFEHQARPLAGNEHSHKSNLVGWLQHRKQIPHEDNRVGFLERTPTWKDIEIAEGIAS